jgi:hypothetical protein
MTLDAIGVKHQTDKSSLNHCYLGFYELLFERYRRLPVQILEIGVQFGNSLRTWREYFRGAYIMGIDSIDNKASVDSAQIIIGNAYTNETVDLLEDHKFNIIIDDGSHNLEDQVFVIWKYHHVMTQDGILIIEDVPGLEAIPNLVKAVPEGFNHATVDLRTAQKNTKDSILFLVWRG